LSTIDFDAHRKPRIETFPSLDETTESVTDAPLALGRIISSESISSGSGGLANVGVGAMGGGDDREEEVGRDLVVNMDSKGSSKWSRANIGNIGTMWYGHSLISFTALSNGNGH
jgi:hypothetical protein